MTEAAQSEVVRFTVENGVAWIRLNRPDRRNAINPDMRTALTDAVRQAARAAEARVVVVTGEGAAFCAGADVQDLTDRDRDVTRLRGDYESLLTGLRSMTKPTVAAIRGAAAGVGASIAFACDLRYASTDAFFREAFVDIGLTVDGGASWLLPRLAGAGRALELFYTGRRLPADEAERWGVVNRVVEPDELEATVREVTEQLAQGPAGALAAMKRSVNYAAGSSFEEAIDFEFLLQGVQMQGDDFQEGVAAFREKRRPRFAGAGGVGAAADSAQKGG